MVPLRAYSPPVLVPPPPSMANHETEKPAAEALKDNAMSPIRRDRVLIENNRMLQA
jgi:hypothetical protein